MQQQLHEQRQMALEEKERLMEHMWGEKQALVCLYMYICMYTYIVVISEHTGSVISEHAGK